MTLGQKLISLRKSRGMTQEELSEAIGVTRQTISKWELDTSTPDLDYLCKLCDLFGVTADYLIRADRETVDASPLPVEPPPAPSDTKEISAIRFAGFALMILGLILTQPALLLMLFSHDSTVFWILAGIAFIFGAELFFIHWKPLFIFMWTAWALVTILLTIGTATLLAVPLILFFHAIPYDAFPFNWHFIFFFLWLLYTAFCICVTIGMIVKHLRKKKAEHP